ncbi:hypothetical protein IM697_18520 [Streptomyces ferrugineus]|uniref:Uncharacterized protein n=1 Tax=Streptomyces ferrugineus TaxID=1413221 RepID=A0A7M2SV43_9ACTN|nr:hypothetical protein [Streptomyces ferrugineus]QOV40217.1 hypothetical protein IM697_18520 [Streptomyces ferrugineus]
MSSLEPSGPVYDAAFNPFGPFVVLAATVTVDGEEITVQQQIDRAAWRCIDRDPQLRADYERTLHHHLAAALVERLSPTVTVYEPAPLGESVSDALARADAAMRNEPEPEHCRSLELGSEG